MAENNEKKELTPEQKEALKKMFEKLKAGKNIEHRPLSHHGHLKK